MSFLEVVGLLTIFAAFVYGIYRYKKSKKLDEL